MAIRTAARDQVRMIQFLTRWPGSPSADWHKGFLAGIFDAEGSYSKGILRIANTDRAIARLDHRLYWRHSASAWPPKTRGPA